jgi:hypothetical protein
MIPVTALQLPFHLAIPGARVQLVEQSDGFVMKVYHSGVTHILHAQRQHVRLFISLTRAAAFLSRHNIHIFSVATSNATPAAIESDLVREFAVTTTSIPITISKPGPYPIKNASTILNHSGSASDDDLADHFLQELEDYKDSL